MRLLSLLCCFALPAFAGTVISPSIAPPNVEESSGGPLLSNTALGRTLESIQEAKEELGLPLTLSAWHWWHIAVDNGPGGTGYGFTGLPGTYYYNAVFDPELALELGPINKAGLYLDFRIRDGGKFRPFFDDQWWFWESYAWVETDFGKFKAGKVWKRFGLDWDGVFYGNLPYFDGFKLDPDWGVSWEHTIEASTRLKIDTFAQFFIQEDRVNGTLVGGDAESSNRYSEQNTGVIRILPTLTLSEGETLAVGFSGQLGNIEDNAPGQNGHLHGAWAVDATYNNGPFRIFGEVSQSYGVINETRYVSGGPSDRITNILTGAHYITGPVTWRLNYQHGFDSNPDGWQSLFLPGATINLTKNLDLYVEYVYWVVKPDSGSRVIFDNGIQLILNWRF